MAGEIAVTPETLRLISAKMQSGAREVEEILSGLSNHVAPVRSEWTGPAQAYFNAFWDQSLHDANDLRSVLVGMATLTERAATAYEATEKRIADSFGEFRNSPNTVLVDADASARNGTADGSQLSETAAVEAATDLLRAGTESEAVTALAEPDLSHEPQPGSDSPSEVAIVDGTAKVETTEIEDGSVDLADPSTASSKANGRLPWTRFTKSSRSEAGDAGTGAKVKVPERRFKTSDPALKPGTRLCRLCFTVVSLEPGLIEKTATHDYVRCPHCGNSFPVRHDDVAGQELS